MAQVSFNFYDEERRITTRLSGDNAEICDWQVERFIEFLRAQGFCESTIFGVLDQRVEEFDFSNPGKLNEFEQQRARF
jgi:hypothetical protein